MTDVILPSEVDIVEVVGEFLELEDMGDTHLGLCPFHGEKTPSFRLYHDTSTFYCWGCHETGDTIDFLREHNKWSFGKSVKHIEDKTNVKLKFEKEFKTEEAKVLSREFNDEVRTEIGSLSHNTKNYRGIRKDIAAYFKVGHEYDTQTGEVSAQYYPCTDSETHKLCGYRVRKVPKDFSTQYGVVGRQADPFGWFRFKKSTGKYCLIVAGEIDQLSAYQMLHDYTVKKGQQEYGFIPVICSTTGEGSVNQFKDKYEWFMGFERIHICMDPDQAGNEAVEKLLKILPRDKVFVMNLQDGMDTNDYLTRGKDKEWINLFFKAQKKTMTGITGSGNLLQEMREYVSMERITLPPFMHKLQDMLKGGVPIGQIFTLLAGSGTGKCFAKGTEVLMFDGTFKKIEDVKQFDLVMGDDSTPRTVLSLSRGREQMYEIIPTKGDPYVVNGSHILSVKNDYKKKPKDVIYEDISVKEFLSRSEDEKKQLYGYRRGVTLEGELSFTQNILLSNNRLGMLAFALSCYGSINGVGNYELATMYPNDHLYLCRSLGFAAYLKEPFISDEDKAVIEISGDLEKIPTRIKRDSLVSVKDSSHLEVGLTVRKLEVDDYYGFELDGNHRFLLSDFTVTHNSTFLDSMVLHWIMNTGYKVGIVSLEASAGEYGVNLGSNYIKNKINLGETVQERLDVIDSNEDKLATLFNDDEGGHRFFLVDADIMDLQSKIENLVVAEGCKIIVLDPIQDIFDALPDDAQAKFMKWQKDLVKREKVTIVNVSHARKSQGGTKGASQGQSLSEEDCHGSSSIFKSSGIIVVLTRNKEAEDPEERNTTTMKMTKARGIGDTGPVSSYYYERDTHQLHDINDWHNRSSGGSTVEF